MRAGVFRVDITPPVGTQLCGFAGRDWRSAGVRDRLTATALWIEADRTAAVILALDTIGLSIADDGALRRAIASRLGVPFDGVLVSCSHTHAGAATQKIRATGNHEASWTRLVVERALAAAVAARDAAVPVDALAQGAAPCNASHNRRRPDGPRDPYCHVLTLVGADGRNIASLLHFAMHPTSLGSADRRLSTDWVGRARADLERSTECPALFLQGCIGDINPKVRDAVVVGSEVGAAAHIATIVPRRIAPSLAVGGSNAHLEFLPIADDAFLAETDARAVATLATPGAWLGSYQCADGERDWVATCRALRAAGDAGSKSVAVRIPAIRLGEATLIGLPGEVFCEIGQRVRDAVPGAWALGFAAGNPGYLYPEHERLRGGYEVELAYKLYGERQSGDSLPALVAGAVSAARAAGAEVAP